MPRPITINDIVHQQVNGYPITVADRLSRWERAEELHRLNRPEAPSPLPPCLEVIIQGCGEAGIASAAHRLRPYYEDGVPVVSDSGLLFGERLLAQELENWHSIIQPGWAACFGDKWFNAIRPQFSDLYSPGTRDFYPTSDQWIQFRDELAGRLDRVLSQGCHIVLVLTRSPFLPPWKELVSVPLVVVETTGRPEGAMATGRYITTQLEVEDLTGGDALLNRSPAHGYDGLTPEMLQEALHLTSLFDYDPDSDTR